MEKTRVFRQKKKKIEILECEGQKGSEKKSSWDRMLGKVKGRKNKMGNKTQE